MYKRLFLFSAMSVAIALTCGTANGDLSITLSPDGSGGMNVEFDGSGTLQDFGTGGAFVYESLSGSFFKAGSSANDVFSNLSPNAPLAGGAVQHVFITEQNGVQGVQWFSPGWNVGGSLSTANGQTFNAPDIQFSLLKQGNYDMQRYDTDFVDVGAVSVSVVPEPASTTVLGMGLLLGLLRRSRRK